MEKLTGRIFAETRYDWANVGAALTERGVVLLDSPVRPTDSLDWQGEVRGLSPLGIRYLIATDYHGDHTTGASFIEDEVTFISPQVVFDEFSKGDNAFSKEIFTKTLEDRGLAEEARQITDAPVPLPDVCFEDSMTLHLEPLTFEIRRLGGHSPATSMIFIPEEGVIFASDIVINEPCPGLRDANVQEWIDALSFIEDLPADRVVPGHGPIGGMKEVGELKEYLTTVLGKMKALAAEGREKGEAVSDPFFDQFFWADTSRGEYWIQQRKDTFQGGLGRVFDEAKGAR
ncbi:MAG: MBL fold metallo-hydrolase [Nitrospinota bacterium]|nr:MBL fold metallo-hydrolase [Nitrospinota bacterium]MDP7371440.1 MBL fold metallo-hydrolase [Nitrospinota bacterium]MDP7503582.1 MBL fold metallo-hydrolase [Nitrospinota bacterium]MDP7663540.1 MBL fold metallo-hydrolase [Nitrospinota bacterium]HJP14301.1 MBL fold metallo-hydrolase [Nitrospinota bacterium]